MKKTHNDNNIIFYITEAIMVKKYNFLTKNFVMSIGSIIVCVTYDYFSYVQMFSVLLWLEHSQLLPLLSLGVSVAAKECLWRMFTIPTFLTLPVLHLPPPCHHDTTFFHHDVHREKYLFLLGGCF